MAASDITAPTVPSEHVVHRSTNLLYTLMHDSWRNGVEQFRNRLMVRVERDESVSDAEHEATIARLSIALAGWQPIESAPKEGTFLVWMPEKLQHSHIHTATFHPNVKVVAGLFMFDLPSQPTHWMPHPHGVEEGGVSHGR